MKKFPIKIKFLVEPTEVPPSESEVPPGEYEVVQDVQMLNQD